MRIGRLIILSLLVFVGHCALANSFTFSNGAYDAMLTKAEDDHKYLFILFEEDSCAPCDEFRSAVLTNDSIQYFLNEKCVGIIEDIRTEEGERIGKKYKIGMLPTVLLVDPKTEKVILGIKGSISYDVLLDRLKSVKMQPKNFKLLLILSEIFIPLIVFIGMYYFFKPVFGPKEEEEETKEASDS